MPPLLCCQIDTEVDAKLRGQSVLDSQPVIPAIYCADVPEQTGLVQRHHLLAHGDTAAGKAVTPEVYVGGQRGLVALSGTGYYRHDRAGGVAQIIADDDNRAGAALDVAWYSRQGCLPKLHTVHGGPGKVLLSLFHGFLSPRIIKDMWKQKSTAQAIVVPCSAEDSLALGGRNGYNIPAVQSLCCFGRFGRLLQAVGSWRSLPLPCYSVFIVIIPLVDRPCNPHRAIARGGKKF